MAVAALSLGAEGVPWLSQLLPLLHQRLWDHCRTANTVAQEGWLPLVRHGERGVHRAQGSAISHAGLASS